MSKASEKYGYDSYFPTRFRELMRLNKVSQTVMGELCGVQRQSISLWCNGDTRPDIISLGKIAEYFNVSTDYLLGLTDCRNPNNPQLVARCGELEERLLLLEVKGRTFDKLLSSIRDISLEYLSELGIDFLLQREVENGRAQDVYKKDN